MRRVALIFLLILIIATPLMMPPIQANNSVNNSNPTNQASRRLNISGAVIEVFFSPQQFDLPEETLLNWISVSAQAVASYYGKFPVPRLSVYIRDHEGSRIGYGSTHGTEIPYIQVNVGRKLTKADLDDDWVMTHEMTHLGFPSINGSHSWIEEGMATYIEPIARARVGTNTSVDVWHDLLRHLPRDLPQYGNSGMEDADNFNEIYWGGALFWLLADVEIRKQTANHHNLAEVFQHLVARGGIISQDWDLKDLLGECDRAVGKRIFNNIYNQMTVTPIKVNVTSLWQQLGVELRGNEVVFNDNAPLAQIRRSITERSISAGRIPIKNR